MYGEIYEDTDEEWAKAQLAEMPQPRRRRNRAANNS
jgi:hypothetical protein